MTNKLTVIAGPANTGKTPIAQFMAHQQNRPLIHRDQLRTLLYIAISEQELTQIQADVAANLLSLGYSPIVVGQNEGAQDRNIFTRTANSEGAMLEWIDSREATIPSPLDPSRRFTLADYDEISSQTAIYPEKDTGGIRALCYCALGLGEAGEVQGKLKKVLRGDKTIHEAKAEILDELGDTLWYIGRMAKELGSNLQHLINRNGRKLLDRKLRGTLQGSGDNR